MLCNAFELSANSFFLSKLKYLSTELANTEQGDSSSDQTFSLLNFQLLLRLKYLWAKMKQNKFFDQFFGAKLCFMLEHSGHLRQLIPLPTKIFADQCLFAAAAAVDFAAAWRRWKEMKKKWQKWKIVLKSKSLKSKLCEKWNRDRKKNLSNSSPFRKKMLNKCFIVFIRIQIYYGNKIV